MEKEKYGISHVINAFFHSKDGLRFVFIREKSFRIEVGVCFFVCLIIPFLRLSLSKSLVLIGSCFAVLIAELVNTAIEVIIDRISYEDNQLSKAAKDIGSLIVLCTIVFAIFVWVSVLV